MYLKLLCKILNYKNNKLKINLSYKTNSFTRYNHVHVSIKWSNRVSYLIMKKISYSLELLSFINPSCHVALVGCVQKIIEK